MTVLPNLERDLIRAAERATASAQDSPARVVRGRLAERAALIGAVVITVLIGAGTVIVLGAHQQKQGPSAAAAGRGELIDALAVLRRPQTTADRHSTLPSPYIVPALRPPQLRAIIKRRNRAERKLAGDPSVDRPLVRQIVTPAGDEISVVPETWQPSRSSPRRAEGLGISIHTPGNSQSVDTGPQPTSTRSFLAHGLAVFNDTRRGVVLVPDGVARVTLRGFEPITIRLPNRPPELIPINEPSIAGQSSAVRDNIATFTLAGLTAVSRSASFELGTAATVRLTWFNAAGRIIRQTTTEFAELYVTVKHA